MNKWGKIGLIILAGMALCGAFFGGVAWRGGKNSASAVPPQILAPKDYTREFQELKEAVTKPIIVCRQPQSPQPNITVNPLVNVTVNQTVNGIRTENQSSSQITPSYPAGINFTLEGLVYGGNFNAYKGMLEESSIDHVWGSGGPFGLTRFSVKWRGSVVIEESGRYRFTVLGDDRVRLEVDDQAVIDKYVSGQPATEYAVDLDLTAGAHKIVLKYFNDIVGDSRIRLSCVRIY